MDSVMKKEMKNSRALSAKVYADMLGRGRNPAASRTQYKRLAIIGPKNRDLKNMRCFYGIQYKRPTSQSSTYRGGVSSRAVDGKTKRTEWNQRSCTHTKKEKGWWAVDLETNHKVDTVTIVNRSDDCCRDRALGAQVFLDKQMCRGSLTASKRTTFHCEGKVGRKLKVQMVREDYLSLCEVKVKGTAVVSSSKPKATLGEQVAEDSSMLEKMKQRRSIRKRCRPFWGKTRINCVSKEGYGHATKNSRWGFVGGMAIYTKVACKEVDFSKNGVKGSSKCQGRGRRLV